MAQQLGRDESWENWLIGQAQKYRHKASLMEQDIYTIQIELEYLRTCLKPIINLHSIQIWDSNAASKSRSLLIEDHSSLLALLIEKLENLISQMTAYAHIWNTNSNNFLRLLKN